jgi:hypothetical protein
MDERIECCVQGQDEHVHQRAVGHDPHVCGYAAQDGQTHRTPASRSLPLVHEAAEERNNGASVARFKLTIVIFAPLLFTIVQKHAILLS